MARQDGYARYTIRIPSELYEQVKRVAGEASVNSVVIAALRHLVANSSAAGAEVSTAADREAPKLEMVRFEEAAKIIQNMNEALQDAAKRSTRAPATAPTPETILAINDERRRCAGIAIEFLLSTGADEAQALASPLVTKILRPELGAPPSIIGTTSAAIVQDEPDTGSLLPQPPVTFADDLPSPEDAYAAMGWDKSLRSDKPEENGNG